MQKRITFYISEKARINLKIISLLTGKSMSDIIRKAIADKIESARKEGMLN